MMIKLLLSFSIEPYHSLSAHFFPSPTKASTESGDTPQAHSVTSTSAFSPPSISAVLFNTKIEAVLDRSMPFQSPRILPQADQAYDQFPEVPMELIQTLPPS
jgi:hypothetical protein